MIAAMVGLLGFSFLWYGIGWNDAHNDNQGPSLPYCKWEDGATEQKACIWGGPNMGNGKGDTIINMDSGRYSFNLTTGEFKDWSK